MKIPERAAHASTGRKMKKEALDNETDNEIDAIQANERKVTKLRY